MQQFRPRKAAALHGAATLMTSLSLSYQLCCSFSLSHSLSLSFSQEPSWLPLRTRETHLQPHNTVPFTVLTSISSSYRHAETYGQPHTHTHVIIMGHGGAVARDNTHQENNNNQSRRTPLFPDRQFWPISWLRHRFLLRQTTDFSETNHPLKFTHSFSPPYRTHAFSCTNFHPTIFTHVFSSKKGVKKKSITMRWVKCYFHPRWVLIVFSPIWWVKMQISPAVGENSEEIFADVKIRGHEMPKGNLVVLALFQYY